MIGTSNDWGSLGFLGVTYRKDGYLPHQVCSRLQRPLRIQRPDLEVRVLPVHPPLHVHIVAMVLLHGWCKKIRLSICPDLL
jgi:hypothetical protein